MPDKPLRGVQAIAYAEARFDAIVAATALKFHRSGCYQCSRAGADTLQYCVDGWDMAKRDARAQSALRKWGESTDAGQETLW